MNNQNPNDHEDTTVVGFEVPLSPVSSYNNVYSGTEDEAKDPPPVPPHLQQSLLGHPVSSESVPVPQNVVLNHLYIENRDAPRSVVALGFSHRFRSNGGVMGGRLMPLESVPSTMKHFSVDGTMKLIPQGQIFREREVKGCMPKGFRPRSAPSRFVNYQPLVSTRCSSSNGRKSP